MAPRLVTHKTTRDFLDTVVKAGGDVPRTNTALGPLTWLYTIGSEFNGLGGDLPDDELQILISVWSEDELKLVFSRLANRKNDLVSPLHPSTYSTLGPHLALLAEALLKNPMLQENPRLLRSTFGPSELVDPFLKHWPIAVAPPAKDDTLAHQTLRLQVISEVPPPSSLPQGHVVERGTVESMTEQDKETMCILLAHFNSWDVPTMEHLKHMPDLLDHLKNGALFVYRVEGGKIVSFVVLGRPTTNTIAIRNVYTAPERRGQGIAERITREVARIYLTAERPIYDFNGSAPPFDKATHWGGRPAVCLFVADENPQARKAYIKADFRDEEPTWVDRVVEGIAPGVW